MAAFLSAIGRFFAGEPKKPEYKTAEIYDGLRKIALGLTAAQVGGTGNEQVLAVIMDTGYPESVATLVAIMDGAASLYFSHGGGMIGLGEHAGPNAAARKLIAKAGDFQSACSITKQFPLPRKGYTRFYLVTPKGVFVSEAVKEDDLGNDRHRLSPLFYTAHELITQMRLIEEKKKGGAEGGKSPHPHPCNEIGGTY